MRIWALVLPMAIISSGCVSSQIATSVDRLRAPAAAHAIALAGDDMAAARITGRAFLAQLEALAGW